MTRRLLPLLLICAFALAPAYAQANCSGPTGIAGTIIFNTTFNVMQYCDGTNWINMGGVAANTAAAGSTGAVQFNTSNALDADSSYFVWDKTNHRLGIGSTTPGSSLDVKGTLRLSGATSGYVGLSPAAAAGSTTYTLPSADGSSGQLLSTNGSGTLSWSTVSTGLPTLTSGYIWVGNGSNAATALAPTGDITITSGGVTAIGSAKVTNSMLAGSIPASKLVGTDIATVGTITSGTWNGSAINLASYATGTLGVANGGTGATTLTSNGVLYGNGTSAVQITAQGAANSILTANAGAPAFSAAPTIGTSVTTPLLIGGTAASSTVTIESTSGTGTSDAIIFKTASQAEAMRINTSGAVGIGTATPNASALLDVYSTTKGFLPPRVTTTQRDSISSPATGLTVYNTTTNALNVYGASSWGAVGSGGGALSTLTDVTLSSPANSQVLAYNGSAWVNSNVGSVVAGVAGPTFLVNKGGTNQTVTATTDTKLTWSTETFDTNNNFASNAFTPTVAGKYIITLQVYCNAGSTYCEPTIKKNGPTVALGEIPTSAGEVMAPITAIVDMNGSTDYVEAWVVNVSGTNINGTASYTYFTGAMLAPLASGVVAGTGSAGYVPYWTSGNALTYDSTSGGQFYWDSTNHRLGIGTSSPGVRLSVMDSSGAGQISARYDASGSGFLINQKTSGGNVEMGNQANAALYFTTNNIERVRIDSSGNVGIGMTPGYKLSVAAGSSHTVYAESTGGYGAFYGLNTTNGSSALLGYGTWGIACLSGNCGGTSGWAAFSDARLKTSVRDLPEADGLSAIMKQRPIRFHWIDKKTDARKGEQIGFIAQDMEKVFPEVVNQQGVDTVIDAGDGKKQTVKEVKSIGYAELTVPLVKAVQELKAANDNQAAALKAANDNTEALRKEFEAYKAAHP